MNRDLIHRRLGALDAVLNDYHIHHEEECRRKRDTFTYAFLTNVYDRPQHFAEVVKWAMGHEKDFRIGQLVVASEEALSKAYERSVVVSETEAATWWYIFWVRLFKRCFEECDSLFIIQDDFWRRNNDAIPALQLHAQDFNPHYPTSVAYTPLPRPNLESFLIQRGLMSTPPRWKDIFHHGLLNKIYVRLNDAVFRGSNQAVMFHTGVTGSEMSMEGVDMGQSSTLGTGGGTDHDDESLRPRPTYRWEASSWIPSGVEGDEEMGGLSKSGLIWDHANMAFRFAIEGRVLRLTAPEWTLRGPREEEDISLDSKEHCY
ncbi:RecF/RecN/SMC [Salix suchowensis]|nr:RecF/RecN/SMC [Salix suchowensis]